MNAGEYLQLRGHKLKVDLIGSSFPCDSVEWKMILFRHTANVAFLPSPNERDEVFRLDIQALFFKHGNRRGIDERLGISEDTIHIKNNGTSV